MNLDSSRPAAATANHPVPDYFCPIHHQRLTRSGSSARCPQCELPFPIEEDIWLLDVVHRGDRSAFDQQVTTSPIPLDLSRAEGMLSAAGIENLENANILDIGCGLGDLCAGLARSPRVRASRIYAFDHSIESVRIAQRGALDPRNAESGNQLHFSTQDASRLGFEPESFDLIAGSAVLHHITDYPDFLRRLYSLLKTSGIAIFAEPFAEGYLWLCVLLRIAVNDLNLGAFDDPELGMCRFILESTEYRVAHAEESALLDELIDKHFFRIDRVVDVASKIGYRTARFKNFAPPSFYEAWMTHFLDIYGIRHSGLRARAEELYGQLKKSTGPALPDMMSHFRYFSLHK